MECCQTQWIREIDWIIQHIPKQISTSPGKPNRIFRSQVGWANITIGFINTYNRLPTLFNSNKMNGGQTVTDIT
jgi:hypothetical protein